MIDFSEVRLQGQLIAAWDNANYTQRIYFLKTIGVMDVHNRLSRLVSFGKLYVNLQRRLYVAFQAGWFK